MRATIAFASVFALATSVLAQETTEGYAAMSAPAKDEKVPAGETYEIKWDAGKYTGDATIELLGGKTEGTLMILNTIDTVKVEDDSYAWAVDCSLGEYKTYGLKIADVASEGAIFQYSFPFSIEKCKGGDDTSSSSSASVSTTASASGYPVETTTSTSTTSTKSHSTSTIASETSTTVATTTGTTTATTFITSTPSSSAAVTSGSVTSAPATTSITGSSTSSTVSSTPVPTAGAARVGAGLALGLVAAVFAL
ncbi:Ser-Thr-rich glycosyl-phosphatidyl-inositol-anchored membrane family-domain-containing protein [Xylariaceae sp. FL1272]|nr:Ser-Thr-rich glycosyl-phosphatidyl-inositol-anchored membrane family-domain-containing protein [Xylariaceae sp. FL1272]